MNKKHDPSSNIGKLYITKYIVSVFDKYDDTWETTFNLCEKTVFVLLEEKTIKSYSIRAFKVITSYGFVGWIHSRPEDFEYFCRVIQNGDM